MTAAGTLLPTAIVFAVLLPVVDAMHAPTYSLPAARGPAAAPPPPICTWNTSATTAKLPGCCGYNPGMDWQRDGCSCGCCKHNFSGVVPPAPSAPLLAPGGRPASTARFLSFYDECPVDRLYRGASRSNSAQVMQHGGGGPAVHLIAAGHHHRRTEHHDMGGADLESLPLVFGMCLDKMPDWGCWRDQLAVVSAHFG